MCPYWSLLHAKGKSLLLHTFPLISWSQDSWSLTRRLRQQRHWVPLPLACICHDSLCHSAAVLHIFSTLSFATNTPIKALPAAFHVLWQTEFQVGFSFPDPILACSGLCLYSSSVTCPCLHLLHTFMIHFCRFVHPCRLPTTFTLL